MILKQCLNRKHLINVFIVPVGRLMKVNRLQSFQGTVHSLKSKSHWNVPTKKRKVLSKQFENTLLGNIRNNYTSSDISETSPWQSLPFHLCLSSIHFPMQRVKSIRFTCSSLWILQVLLIWLEKFNCKVWFTFKTFIFIVWFILYLEIGII